MADNPQLVVAITARLDQFEKQLKQAGLIAEREIKTIETKTSQIAIGSGIGIAAVDAIKAAIQAIKEEITKSINEMLALGDAAKKTGLDFETLQRMVFAAQMTGLGKEEALKAFVAANEELERMAYKTTRVSEMWAANGVTLTDNNGKLIDANKYLEKAADLIAKGRSQTERQDIARAIGVPQNLVPMLENGSAAFREMQASANNVNKDLDLMLANLKALQTIAIQVGLVFSSWGLSITGTVLDAIARVVALMSAIATKLAQVTAGGPLEGFAENLANKWQQVDGIVKSTIANMNNPKITVFGGGANWPQQLAAGVDWLTRFDQQLSKHINLLEAEARTVGLTVGEREKERQLALLKEAAQRNRLTLEQALTEERRKQIDLAAKDAQLVAEKEHRFQNLLSISSQIGSALSNSIADMALEGKKLNDVMKDLSKTLAKIAINQAMMALFAPTAGGGPSEIMKLLGLGARQAGGPVYSGQPYVVGEKGPELFVPNAGGYVVPNNAMRGGGAVQNNVTVNDYSGQASVSQKRDASGSSITVLVPALETMLAGGVSRGRGALVRSVDARVRGAHLYG
jgi:hypothetical protein